MLLEVRLQTGSFATPAFAQPGAARSRLHSILRFGAFIVLERPCHIVRYCIKIQYTTTRQFAMQQYPQVTQIPQPDQVQQLEAVGAFAALHNIPRPVAEALALQVAERCALMLLRFKEGRFEHGAEIGARLIAEFTPPNH